MDLTFPRRLSFRILILNITAVKNTECPLTVSLGRGSRQVRYLYY